MLSILYVKKKTTTFEIATINNKMDETDSKAHASVQVKEPLRMGCTSRDGVAGLPARRTICGLAKTRCGGGCL